MIYTALVLDDKSKNLLLNHLGHLIAIDWQTICHHMTINLGPPEKGPAKDLIGQIFEIQIDTFAQDNRVLAVGVSSECPSNNKIKHITVAINLSNGGKPKYSNDLKNWLPIEEDLVLSGVVQVCGD